MCRVGIGSHAAGEPVPSEHQKLLGNLIVQGDNLLALKLVRQTAYKSAEAQARSEIEDHINSLGWYDFQKLVVEFDLCPGARLGSSHREESDFAPLDSRSASSCAPGTARYARSVNRSVGGLGMEPRSGITRVPWIATFARKPTRE